MPQEGTAPGHEGVAGGGRGSRRRPDLLILTSSPGFLVTHPSALLTMAVQSPGPDKPCARALVGEVSRDHQRICGGLPSAARSRDAAYVRLLPLSCPQHRPGRSASKAVKSSGGRSAPAALVLA